MLSCEKCAQELTGGAVICRNCGFNNALRRVDRWREQRRLAVLPLRPAPDAPSPFKPSAQRATPGSRAASHDATLIPFPSVHKTPASDEARERPETDKTYPPWRKELSERVRQIRQQRTEQQEERHPHTDGTETDRNPIIESALRRIKRAEYLPPLTPRRTTHAAAAAVPLAQHEATAEAAPQTAPAAPSEAAAALPARNAAVSTPTSATPPEMAVKARPVGEVRRIEARTRRAVSDREAEAQAVPEAEVTVPVEAAAKAEVIAEVAEEVETPEVGTSAADLPQMERAARPAITVTAAERVVPTAGQKPAYVESSLRQRAAAALIDAEVAAFGYLVVFAALMLSDLTLTGALRLALLLTAALVPVYYAVSFAFAGRTFGMSLLKLHTGTPTGEERVTSTGIRAKYEIAPLTTRAILARTLGGTASLLLFPFNLLVIWRDAERLSISDHLSDTRVVSLLRKHESR